MSQTQLFNLTREEILALNTFGGEPATIDVDLEEDLIKTYCEHAKSLDVRVEDLLSAATILYCRELLDKDEQDSVTNYLDDNRKKDSTK